MKRFITAMLTLALTTALSSEKASAQDRMQPQTQLRDNGYYTGMVGKRHIGYEPAGQVERYGLLQNAPWTDELPGTRCGCQYVDTVGR